MSAVLTEFQQSVLWHVMTGRLQHNGSALKKSNPYPSERLKFILHAQKGQQLNQDCLLPDGKYPLFNGGEAASGYTNQFNKVGPLVTISEGGSKAGSVNFVSGKCWVSGHCYSVHAPHMSPAFTYYWLQANITHLYRLAQGIGMPNIPKRDLLNLSLPLPPPEERARILAFIEKFTHFIPDSAPAIKALNEWYQSMLFHGLTGGAQ